MLTYCFYHLDFIVIILAVFFQSGTKQDCYCKLWNSMMLIVLTSFLLKSPRNATYGSLYSLFICANTHGKAIQYFEIVFTGIAVSSDFYWCVQSILEKPNFAVTVWLNCNMWPEKDSVYFSFLPCKSRNFNHF